jgi:hypothetical protein
VSTAARDTRRPGLGRDRVRSADVPLLRRGVRRPLPRTGRLPGRAGKQAWAFLPLTASGTPSASASSPSTAPRRLTDEERTLLTTISALVAQALERARLYDAEHTRSRELQRSLLPRDLPDLPACTAAARYLPAGQGMDVGGDWYDIIPLSGGQVALVVGDVMGHGLPEAATMGRLRTAVHTLADLELPPDEIMSHLNEHRRRHGRGVVRHLPVRALRLDHADLLHRPGRPSRRRPWSTPTARVHFPELSADPPARRGRTAVRDGRVEGAGGQPPRALHRRSGGVVEARDRRGHGGPGPAAARGAHTDRVRTDPADLEKLCDTLTAGLLPAEHRRPTTPPSSSPGCTP